MASGKRRRVGAKKILSESEVDQVAKMFSKAMPGLERHLEDYGLSFADTVRVLPLAQECKIVRSERGLNIKKVAAELRVPQYRIRDIEKANVDRIQLDVLKRYTALLDLQEMYREWAKANEGVVRKWTSS